MIHDSVLMEEYPCEIINVVPCNPLISKCQIKVCYVGDDPNRNRSVISKEVARKMANSLPGSPIVGYFNEEKGDFEEHSKTLDIKDGKIVLKDATRPYGFVDLGAKCWFQKFLDDNENVHEYLMTEGYIWTGQYPESKRIVDKGNNQSMELADEDEFLDATWTKDNNGNIKFFIINEAIISKLCVLGDHQEPCFEGSRITGISFSFEDNFKQELYDMIHKVEELLEKGGNQMKDPEVVLTNPEENLDVDFKKKDEEEEKEKNVQKEDKEDKSDKEKTDNNSEDDKSESSSDEKEESESKDDDKKDDEEEEEKDKKKKYVLEEIPEYVELLSSFSSLQESYDALVVEKNNLESQMNALVEFKNQVDKKDKEALINSFYMLTDEDKADVITNINEYSLDEIEAKLSVICFRNKVSFAALDEEEDQSAEQPFVYNLGAHDNDIDDSIPAWVKAVMDTAKTLN